MEERGKARRKMASKLKSEADEKGRSELGMGGGWVDKREETRRW